MKETSGVFELSPEQYRLVDAVRKDRFLGLIASANLESIFLDGAKRFVGLDNYQIQQIRILAGQFGTTLPI